MGHSPQYPTLRATLLWMLCIAFFSQPAAVIAQSGDAPLDTFRDRFKTEMLSVGLFTRVIGQYRLDEGANRNGFDIESARVSARGSLDNAVSYFLQTSLVDQISLLDARLTYRFASGSRLNVGLFKAPFSGGFLISKSNTDFLNRSQVVSNLALRRQVGISLTGLIASEELQYNVGVFNGNGGDVGGNDNNAVIFVGRIVFFPTLDTGDLEIGLKAAFGDKGLTSDSPDEFRFGADLRLTQARWFLSGEGIYNRAETVLGDQLDSHGYQMTFGYALVPSKHQVLARLDGYGMTFGNNVVDYDSHILSLGYTLYASPLYKLQVNYFAPVGGIADAHWVVAGVQVTL